MIRSFSKVLFTPKYYAPLLRCNFTNKRGTGVQFNATPTTQDEMKTSDAIARS